MPPSEALSVRRVPGETASEAHAPHAAGALRSRKISVMRASVGQRLGLVAAVLASLWAAVIWALN